MRIFFLLTLVCIISGCATNQPELKRPTGMFRPVNVKPEIKPAETEITKPVVKKKKSKKKGKRHAKKAR